MRPIIPSLCAFAWAMLLMAPARAADQAAAPARIEAPARAEAALPASDFSRSLTLVVARVSDLPPAELLGTLARRSQAPATSSSDKQASRVVLSALWSSPEVSTTLLGDLEKAGTPEAAAAAKALSVLLQARRPQIEANRTELAARLPELRALTLPVSGEELFDGALSRRAQALGPDAGEPKEAGGRVISALAPFQAADGRREAPSVDQRPAKQGFLARNRHVAAYSAVVGFSAPAMKLITSLGRGLVGHAPAVLPGGAHAVAAAALLSPFPLFLLQLGLIIGVGKLFSIALSRLGQPSVIGYIIGGLALGPSLLGAILPVTAAALFPAASLGVIQLVSQIGLTAFMFCVGHELDLGALKKQSGSAGLISHASIFIPFVLGSALSLLLFPVFAPAGVPFLAFCLFSGIALSITAFPVLASILHEKRMTSTPLGALAMASAAIDDVTGWALLAFVLAVAGGGSVGAVGHILGWSAAYLAAMFGAVRPLLSAFGRRFSSKAWYPAFSLALLAGVTAFSSLATEHIGIHALFGAFLAGVVAPRGAGALSEKAAGRIQRFSAAFLLPAFFALSGLRTHLGLLASPALWGVAVLVMAAAVIGKLGASAAAARVSGMSWRDSLSIGALMNTRGLMELVVLNIAYDKGIISGPLFAVFVVMALATTMMTGPLLKLFSPKMPSEAKPSLVS